MKIYGDYFDSDTRSIICMLDYVGDPFDFILIDQF
jgi:hypothetical protein